MSKKVFSKLFKYSTKKQIQEWQIIAEDDKFYTIEGIQNGKLTTSLPTICKAKNENKKNFRTPEQQALAEAQAKWQKKVDSGYNEVLSAGDKFFKPMLADKLEDRKDLLFKVRTFIQPKLDGLRCVNENNTLMSRNGKPYVACPHLHQTDVTFDGELYSHEYKEDFNKIVSLCKKIKPTQEELNEAADKVEMWVYDFPNFKGIFSIRYAALVGHLKIHPNPKIKLVPTFEVFSMGDIERFHEKFLEEGYEGSIIRLDLGPYENKRSKQLLKYKNWMDEEFELVGAEEGEGGRAGTIGKFYVRLDKTKPYSIEEDINICKSNVKGDFEFLREVWKDHKKYIGTDATIKFFGFTPDGSLRFPYIIKLNRSEYE